MFPSHWTTERTRIDNVRPEEAASLAVLFTSSSDIARFDPTFHPVDEAEVLTLIEESRHSEAQAQGFRMQAMRLRRTDDLIGYLHFREATPQPDVVGLTMFVIRPEFRSNGYGHEIADALIGHLSRDPMNRAVWARVYLKNTPALRFWIGRGFTQVVQHRGRHVHVEGEHTSVILERVLS